MPRKKFRDLTLPEIMQRLKDSTLSQSPSLNDEKKQRDEGLEDLDTRVRRILGILEKPNRKHTNMLFFVMYDIENNKVRRLVAKYLLEKGCFRIQDSIFLADLSTEKYETIRKELTLVQECYENNDSILVVPMPADYLNSMKIIGKKIDVDLILKNKNTLFF